MKKRSFLTVSGMLVLAFVLSIALGAVTIPPGSALQILLGKLPWFDVSGNWPEYFETILWEIRLPHTILVALTGAALAGSGAAFQGLFRNPLADPYLIGVASGAGLGAIAIMSFSQAGKYLIPVGAFLGALGTIYAVYALAKVGRIVPLTTLILAGVAIGSFTAALTSFLMLISDQMVLQAMSFLLGGSTVSGWEPLIIAFPYLVTGMTLLILSGHSLNVLQFGEEQAQQLGLSVEKIKILIIVAASLTTAAAVSFSGVIGFVGLVVPHVIRMIWGGDYKKLIPLSILGGGFTLLISDLAARIVMAPRSLPVGIVTALVGAPFFLWILRKAKREVFW
ncbi:MAG: iron ABC transporter permease [Deltaproteobacteria bacterium]|nr:iron ABC transporter permease [Deltaproteobacteria bacterium]